MMKISFLMLFGLVYFSSQSQIILKGNWIEEISNKRSGAYFEFNENLKFNYVLMNGLGDMISNGTYYLQDGNLILNFKEQYPTIQKKVEKRDLNEIYFTLTYRCEPIPGVNLSILNTKDGRTSSIDGVAILDIGSYSAKKILRVTGYGMKPVELSIGNIRGFNLIEIDMVVEHYPNYDTNRIIKISNEKLVIKRGVKKKFKRRLIKATQKQVEYYTKIINDDC